MFEFKNCVMTIMSKSPSGHLIRLEGKLIVTGKGRFLLHFSVCYCTSHQPISMVDLG
jgi:hypothetical protein